ncbi:hypothetical protein [Paracoccus pacificus]|uniref:Uncharacterized protein n=1 Tax=Paracoccus pacificus TaxID=1463598 RepID=A0ABW4R832_9RHOB
MKRALSSGFAIPHPGGLFDFSEADDQSDARVIPGLFEALGSLHGSAIMTPDGRPTTALGSQIRKSNSWRWPVRGALPQNPVTLIRMAVKPAMVATVAESGRQEMGWKCSTFGVEVPDRHQANVQEIGAG